MYSVGHDTRVSLANWRLILDLSNASLLWSKSTKPHQRRHTSSHIINCANCPKHVRCWVFAPNFATKLFKFSRSESNWSFQFPLCHLSRASRIIPIVALQNSPKSLAPPQEAASLLGRAAAFPTSEYPSVRVIPQQMTSRYSLINLDARSYLNQSYETSFTRYFQQK